MEFGNDGISLYHNIAAIFARSTNGDLLFISGVQSVEIKASWGRLRQDVGFGSCQSSSVTELMDKSKHDSVLDLDVHELRRQGDSFIAGVFVKPLSAGQTTKKDHLFYRFICHILERVEFSILNNPAVPEDQARSNANTITNLFSDTLRNIPALDEWDSKGRDFFEMRIEIFTRQNAMIEMVLPAFPCKSSNTEKVSGADPDKGEELALKEIEKFAAAVEEIYPPGCKVWIVSDGHVFSDTIGVHDKEVDRYSRVLRDMYVANKVQTTSGRDRVGFLSLADCFGLHKDNPLLQPSDVASMELPHFLDTELTDEAEFCRKLLIAGFQIDGTSLRKRIEGEDKAMVALYRGFSRFMLEDLAMNPRIKSMSRSQAKKLAPKVAFEMIKRNQAYSNLVETVFPMHVRLSIHAHSNAGPKFGIRTLPKEMCRGVESLTADLANSSDLLHIPTPWHNSICRIEGDKFWYVTKSRAIRDALAKRVYTGEFVAGNGKDGGYYFLTRVPTPPKRSASMLDAIAKLTMKRKPTVRIEASTVAAKSTVKSVKLRLFTKVPLRAGPISAKPRLQSGFGIDRAATIHVNSLSANGDVKKFWEEPTHMSQWLGSFTPQSVLV